MNVKKLGVKCNGCSACYNVCKKNAISMHQDEKGFFTAKIDKDKCVNCGLCTRVCPLLKMTYKELFFEGTKIAVAFKSDDKITQLESASGGFFYVLANSFIDRNGVVYGAAYDENWHVNHIRCTTINDISRLRESKYAQSELDRIFTDVKKDLEHGMDVLFSGTSCQIAGLKAFLKKEYDHLLLVDVVCHGVPSPKIWDDYVKMIEKENNNKIVGVKHKDKSENGWSWEKQFIRIDFENGDRYKKNIWKDSYMRGFLNDIYLRDTCYNCVFKNQDIMRVSDMSIADFWGCESVEPDFYDSNGVSLVLVNSDKGLKMMNGFKTMIKPTNLKKAVKYNYAVIQPYNQYKGSKYFWANYKEGMNLQDFNQLVEESLLINGKDKASKVTILKNEIRIIYKSIIRKGKRLLLPNNHV